jgi:hypothetical protein
VLSKDSATEFDGWAGFAVSLEKISSWDQRLSCRCKHVFHDFFFTPLAYLRKEEEEGLSLSHHLLISSE